jgi:glycosyltransferase involved in cell wall biosynthesis
MPSWGNLESVPYPCRVRKFTSFLPLRAMRILLSAIACHPEQGSEGGVGWKAAAALSKQHKVNVLTSNWSRPAVRKALSTGAFPNLSFTFFGTDAPYHENRLIARLQSWTRYLKWTRESLDVARDLASKQQFDLAHHVTYSSWRVPSPLWKLALPFVWGPVGGAAEYPRHLLGRLAPRSALFEMMRGLSNMQSSRSRALQDCVRKSSAVVASNQETFDRLLDMRGRADGLHLLFPTFFTAQQVESLRFDPAHKSAQGPLRLFAGGNMIGSKGLVFALEALEAVSQQGVSWKLVVGGYGPEIPFLKRKAKDFGISDRVEFHMGFAGAEYIKKLKESHIFILPSFRENAGITMLEAMLAGCVPVIVDASAQAAVVDNTCGFKIPVRGADEISAGLADAIRLLARNPQQRVVMGQRASELIARSFREDNYLRDINDIYAGAVDRWSSTRRV